MGFCHSVVVWMFRKVLTCLLFLCAAVAFMAVIIALAVLQLKPTAEPPADAESSLQESVVEVADETIEEFTPSKTLAVVSRTHLFGGGIPTEGRRGGSYDISVAWSGSDFAVVYCDYAHPIWNEGVFVALVGRDGQIIVPPACLLAHPCRNTKVLWDGTAYICLVGMDEVILLKRVLPNGSIECEALLEIAGGRRDYFDASLDRGILHIIRGNREGGVEYVDFSTEGKRLTKPHWIFPRGRLEGAAFLDHGCAIRSRVNFARFERFFSLEMFDRDWQRVAPSAEMGVFSDRVSRDCKWNGSGFVYVAGRETKDGIELVTVPFNRWTQQERDPSIVVTFPLPSRFGIERATEEVNDRGGWMGGPFGFRALAAELVWSGAEFLLVWDQSGPDRTEDIWARMLDSDGIPTSAPLKINTEPLERCIHASVLTDDGFAIFYQEQGDTNPSVSCIRVAPDKFQPTFTPTPIVDGVTPTPTPVIKNQVSITLSGSVSQIEIQRNRVTTDGGDEANVRFVFSEPLPSYSVDVIDCVISGPGFFQILDQARPWNDFKIYIRADRRMFFDRNISTTLTLRWGNEVKPGPSPTPTPPPTDMPSVPLKLLLKTVWEDLTK
ncbi:MAG: hypothetical protein ABIH23_20585 [bacterium]